MEKSEHFRTFFVQIASYPNIKLYILVTDGARLFELFKLFWFVPGSFGCSTHVGCSKIIYRMTFRRINKLWHGHLADHWLL